MRVSSSTASLRHLGTVAVCILLAACLAACSWGSGDSAGDERLLELEAKAQSLEESLEALTSENTDLKGEIAILRKEQADFVEAQEAAEAAREHEEEVADFEEEQEEQLSALEEGQIRTAERLADLDARLQYLEEITSKMESAFTDKEQWSKDGDKQSSLPEGAVLERTVSLVQTSGGEVHYVEHPGRGDLTVLVTPL